MSFYYFVVIVRVYRLVLLSSYRYFKMLWQVYGAEIIEEKDYFQKNYIRECQRKFVLFFFNY